MFTGIIQQTGTIDRIGPNRITVRSGFDHLERGESIAVNGVCLTVDSFRERVFSADMSGETLKTTTMAFASKGDRVHLERALLPTSRMGGHIVQGHVDGTGEIKKISRGTDSTIFEILIPEQCVPYCARKGSIAIDGISLTIAAIRGRTITAVVIPLTLAHTHWPSKKPGSQVNIETDIVAKYVERSVIHSRSGDLFQKKDLDISTLIEGGFE